MSETFKLPARLDLPAAQKLSQQLRDMDFSAPVHFDAGEVTHLGTLCVQLLMAAARSAQDAGNQIEIANVSERVEGQLAALGLSSDALMEGAR